MIKVYNHSFKDVANNSIQENTGVLAKAGNVLVLSLTDINMFKYLKYSVHGHDHTHNIWQTLNVGDCEELSVEIFQHHRDRKIWSRSSKLCKAQWRLSIAKLKAFCQVVILSMHARNHTKYELSRTKFY